MSALEAIVRNIKDGWVLGPTFPMRHISKLFGRKIHSTSISGFGKLFIRSNSSDAEVFVQIFRNREYDISSCKQFPRVMAAYDLINQSNHTPVIIDAGANIGAASIWFSKQFPKAEVVGIEPDEENSTVCRMNIKGRSNIKLIQAAIGSDSGSVSLSNPAHEAWAIRTTRNNAGVIPICTIQDIMRTTQKPAKLFLVKIDIEGFEEDLFAKNTEWLNEVEVLIIELHDWLFPGSGVSRNFQKAIAEHQFEMLVSGENIIYVRLRN